MSSEFQVEQEPPPASPIALESLREALDQLPESFVICDAADRIVFANRRFRKMNEAVEAWTQPGTPYVDFLRHAAAGGLFPFAEGRETDWLATAMARRRGKGEWPLEFQRSDGTWLLANFSRLADGGSITFGIDITARKRAEEALRQQSELLLIGQRTAGIVIVDWDIAKDEPSWSDSPEWLRGPLPPGGKYPLYKDQVHPDDREQFVAVRARGIATRERHDTEYRVVRTDGQMLWVRSERTVLAGADGKAARMLVALHNITQRKEAELALQRLNEELEQRVEERTAALDFRMGNRVEALLKLARLPRDPLVQKTIDMTALARVVCAGFSAEYPEVRIELGELLPAHGDRTLVRQLLTSLIGNALKCSAKANPPRVEIGPGGDGSYFVRDNGIGFDMTHARNLFRPFERLDREAEDTGTSVDLALADRIVEHHRGLIWAESEPGQGATFRFTLAER